MREDVIGNVTIRVGDCLDVLRAMPDDAVQTCVTSPPYFGLRDYGMDDQIGLEPTPDEFVSALVEVFREVRRVLRDDGTLWLNLGDSYASVGGQGAQRGQMADRAHGKASRSSRFTGDGLKSKDLIGIPWRVAFALQADGWYLRQDIIWHKPNPMPESVTDRCTKSHEYIFMLSKSQKYYFDHEAIREPSVDSKASAKRYESAFGGKKNEHLRDSDQQHTRPIGMREFDGKRNKRSVWTVTTKPFSGSHFAAFPPDLIEPCILAGSKPGDMVLDPFGGTGTTGLVSAEHSRRCTLIELNPEYAEIARRRIEDAQRQERLFA